MANKAIDAMTNTASPGGSMKVPIYDPANPLLDLNATFDQINGLNSANGFATVNPFTPGVPQSSAWTVIGSPAPTVTESTVYGGFVQALSIAAPYTGNGADNWSGLKRAAPAAPYRIMARLQAITTTYAVFGGIGFIDATGAIQMVGINNSASSIQCGVAPSLTGGFTVSTAANDNVDIADFHWLYIENDGTNITFGYSADGVNGVSIFTATIGGAGLADYDHVIAIVDANSPGGVPPYEADMVMTLLTWDEAALDRSLSSVYNPTAGGVLGQAAGGTGQSSFGTSGQVLTSQGAGQPAEWTTPYVPPSVPSLSQFTVANQPSGCTFADTAEGVQMSAPSGSSTLQALAFDAVPGDTFTLDCDFIFGSVNGGAYIGVYVADSSGKVVAWGPFTGNGGNEFTYMGGNMTYWTAFSGSSSSIFTSPAWGAQNFVRIVYDGANFNFWSGVSADALLLRGTESATAYLSGAPASVGIFRQGTQPAVAVFTYANLGA